MITVRGLTIDDASTRDIDDAIWVEETSDQWKATISIADVAGVVLERDAHDLRARQMVETKYFAAGNSPMLDRRLSEDELSLWPGKKRGVVAVSVIIDKATTTVVDRDTEVSLATLKSAAKLTYQEIPTLLIAPILRQEHVPSEHHTVITSASSLARALLDKRRLDGAFVLYDLNNGWITTEEGFLRRIESHEATIGHIIVQELMILANSAVARWAVNRDIPILFRNHEARSAAPDRTELQRQLDGALSLPMQSLDSLRQRTHLLLDRASYGSSVLGHYGLNLPVYTHFTSPIRRYADLVNHRQIRNALTGGDRFFEKNQITEFAEHINGVLKAEDVARSQAMKQKHERKAVRAIDARRLDGLPHKEFERVTKIEARSGEDPSAAFLDAFTLRTRESKTSLLAMAVVLTQAPTTDAWRPVRGVIVEALARRPEDAVSVLAQAPQISERWGIPRYELVAGVEFEAAAWVRVDGTTSMGKASAKQKKRAEQLAAVALLAGLSGVPVPDAISLGAPTTSTTPPAPAAPTLNPAKDPISTLQEWGQLHDASPGYLFDIHGPPHAPIVTCTCRVVIKRGEREFLARAEAGNKPTAKRAAAVEMILVLATERQ